jgi:anti-sigma B factor antagonist
VAATLLAIERQQDDQSTTLVLRGEVDLASAAQLEHELADAAQLRPSRIVVGLAGVEFIDCVGMRTLIRGKLDADSNRRSLELRHIPPHVKRLLKLTGAADAFATG